MASKYCSSSQHTVIRSASNRSRGDGFCPATSSLIALRLRGTASWLNTSSPDILLTMLRSTSLARSTNRAILGASSSTLLSTGRASLSAVLSPVYQSHEFLFVLDQLRGAFVVLGRAIGFLWAHVSTSIPLCCADDTRRRAKPSGPEDPKPPTVHLPTLPERRGLAALLSSRPPALHAVAFRARPGVPQAAPVDRRRCIL